MYNENSIKEMSEIEHLRLHPGMYVGNTENPTRLIDEVLDNSLDEVQACAECNKIIIIIDRKEGYFSVIDNGRGIPFKEDESIHFDPPVMISTRLRTSGKFQKGQTDSAYGIATGLHGIGLTACNFLSDKMEIEIYRNNKYAKYQFIYGGDVKRSISKCTQKKFGTKITVYPSGKHFKNRLDYDIAHIEERLRIAVSNFKDLNAMIVVDNEKKVISGNENDLILDYLGEGVNNWIGIVNKKGIEEYSIKIGWDIDDTSPTMKNLNIVNLIKINEGIHVTRVCKAIRTVFNEYKQKYKKEFNNDDCLRWLRFYNNLKILKTSFEAQIKIKLGADSDISILDNLEDNLRSYFKKNEDKLINLLNRFESYRKSITNKKIFKKSNTKRVVSGFTKLCDCTLPNGELLIGEGDSAVGGLKQVRDPKKHAILPLRGVIANAITKKDLLKNIEVKEIIQALGCGIDKDFNIHNLRYDKIILAADADPAGQFITALLIGLFISLMPELIKQSKVYVCVTPLYGYGEGSKFVPLWSEDDMQNARSNHKIRRFKGLGEFDPIELERFTLNKQHRKLIQLQWGEKIDDLISLYSNSNEKKDLIMKQGKWIN